VEKTESQRVTFATEWQREAWLQVRSIRGGALPSNMVDFTSSSDASTLTAADDVLVRWVRADQLLSVRRSVRAVVPSGMAVGLAAAGVALYSSASSTEPLAWLLLVVLSNAFRAFVCRSVRASERSPGGLDELGIAGQLRLVTLSSFLSGCVWALLPMFCSSEVPSQTLFFMTVVCGVCAGSVIYSAAYAPVPVAFVTPALLSVTGWLLWTGGFYHNALALMVVMYLGTLVHASLRGDRAYQVSSRLKNEALFMASELRQTHAQSSRTARELDFRANHDSLTGLFNREGFFEAASRFDHAMGSRHDHAALMLDLDGFKAVNDAFGHKTGDQVLQDVGRWLQARLAKHDAVVGRWGGDEFAVFYHPRGGHEGQGGQGAHEGPDAPEAVAEELIRSIGQATSSYGGQLGLSIGICTGHDCSVAEMLSFSDEALYEAKRLGRNRCHRFDHALHSRLLSRRDIERDLAEAIASNAICVWYQPILGEGGHRLHSLEALLRWQHPRHGWVAPADVIYAAANTGLAERLLRHILGEICKGIEQLSAAGARFDDVPVAMNVSPREMSQLPVDAIVLDCLARHGLPTHRLQIEITEEVALDTSAAKMRLRALAEAGISIVIDDFGVGYSSLASLRGEHVRQVKIDRSFILNLASSPGSRLMVEAVIRLGQSLFIEVVAEGVENREELEALKALGSPLLQGYYFMRPAPLAKVIAWAEQREDAATAQS
jgi:diguanylate cyclase (GGDEF)-like protein